jgi:CRP-like cAMP-binding protein
MHEVAGGALRSADPEGNALLRRLPESEFEPLAERLDVLEFAGHEQLFAADTVVEHVYFPLDALASLVTEAGHDTLVEVGAIGSEGMVGVPVFLGARTSSAAAFCQVPGRMARLASGELRAILEQAPTLRDRLGLFTNLLMAELVQNAACNRIHEAEQRCARWLLLTSDRVGRDRFDLTHRFLAQMLGVRRATVSEIAKSLADAGLISYWRGSIVIRDRAGLAAHACPCYERLRTQLSALFPP